MRKLRTIETFRGFSSLQTDESAFATQTLGSSHKIYRKKRKSLKCSCKSALEKKWMCKILLKQTKNQLKCSWNKQIWFFEKKLRNFFYKNKNYKKKKLTAWPQLLLLFQLLQQLAAQKTIVINITATLFFCYLLDFWHKVQCLLRVIKIQ